MCVSPSYVWVLRGPTWEKIEKPCGVCWRCEENRRNDWVGRCMAEASTSAHVCVITLTYAPRDDLADRVLHPPHFQLFMKRLRRSGHKVRYLVAGEYGDLKGRAHFHAVLFFRHIEPQEGPVPSYQPRRASAEESGAFCRQIPQEQMVHLREWPHGHVKCDWSISERSVRYVCEYVLKDRGTGWLSMSKKPPLGAEFFAAKAAQARELGVLPSMFTYQPPGASTKRRYVMTGVTRREYLRAVTEGGADQSRMSEWCSRSYDKLQAYLLKREIWELEKLRARGLLCDWQPPDDLPPMDTTGWGVQEWLAFMEKMRDDDYSATYHGAVKEAST